jgi:hypothetical protein
MTDLLPCPFCGGEAVRTGSLADPPNNHVICTACPIATRSLPGQESTEVWNTRALTRQVSDEGLREHRDFWLKSWVELEAAATALVAKIDGLSEGECGPFAIKNSIANSPEMDVLRAALPSDPTDKSHAEIMAEASPADLDVIDDQVSDDAVVERVARVLNKHFGVGNEEHWIVYCAAARAAIEALSATKSEAPFAEGVEYYPLQAWIWKRTSVEPPEWVLDLSGEINDCNFSCRHTEPLSTPPEDVAGLPSHANVRRAAQASIAKLGSRAP